MRDWCLLSFRRKPIFKERSKNISEIYRIFLKKHSFHPVKSDWPGQFTELIYIYLINFT